MTITKTFHGRHHSITMVVQSTTVEGHSFLTDYKYDYEQIAHRTVDDFVQRTEIDDLAERHVKEKR